MPREEAQRLRGLLFDLDDTVLTHGLLTRAAYGALWDLRDAGLALVAVTGRPSGWGEVVARQWPVEGCVTENGAVSVARDGSGVAVHDACDEAERRARRMRLAQIIDDVRLEVPEARLTDDIGARRADVTWDIGERLRMPEDRVAAIQRVIAKAGARSFRSSVHLHATFDSDDKASGAVRFLGARLGVDSGEARARFAFAGDSGNDAACFAAFRVTFGVANVARWAASLSIPPRWVASKEMGDGFAEIARAIVAARE
jgi:hydroxymethylpyrimidine pyrophosphatase-like HAD family hydrolase